MAILKGYNSKHRPVKKDSTTVNVNVYMAIHHIEKIDEYEQTMTVHGNLWATWTDEYLVWSPKEWNDTYKVAIDTWKIWQPALALYNSAKGNSWHIYMHGMPAMECPIVLADWVYDLSKVNLSDPAGEKEYNKPTIKLSYDPAERDIGADGSTSEPPTTKKHVSGWEVTESWRKHCYWGPSGCTPEMPDGQPEWYWSLLEFGVKMKRHQPYFAVTILLPTLVTCYLTLMTFFLDTHSIILGLLIFNLCLQGLFGWQMIRDLPPGSGGVPKIVVLYSINMLATLFLFLLISIFEFLLVLLPDDYDFGFDLREIAKKCQLPAIFTKRGISFDPQQIFNPMSPTYTEDPKEFNSPLASIPFTSSALQMDNRAEEEQQRNHVGDDDGQQLISTSESSSSLIPLETALQIEEGQSSVASTSSDERDSPISKPTTSQGPTSSSSTPFGASAQEYEPLTPLGEQLFTFRRLLLIVYGLIYLVFIPYTFIF
ncbi:hypothetical protein WR25_09131 [Diploscapter pachys]|uniref:Neurotransmitter-gated ion-channel ligand-binding domain-containing protein n=1 Tax=Diploscapter pachys TaxID=2018661 RepID=A0A2A2LIB4_9BILA|nr:hypothetical protein WR25_09131 [Diploscapter pachys]